MKEFRRPSWIGFQLVQLQRDVRNAKRKPFKLLIILQRVGPLVLFAKE